MFCPNCGVEITAAANFCGRCGSKLTTSGSDSFPSADTVSTDNGYHPAIPDGYELDVGSGLYYRAEKAFDSNTGAPTERMTYYDPVSGSYTDDDNSHPSPEPAAVASARPAIPEGYQLDPQSGLYYQSTAGVSDDGAPIQWVTYLNPNDGTFKQISYPVEGAEAAPEAAPEAGVEEAEGSTGDGPEAPEIQEAIAGSESPPIPDVSEETASLEYSVVDEDTPLSEPELEPETAPEPEPIPETSVQEPAPASAYPPPEGYALDTRSGLYYISKTGFDPQSGAPSQLVTYFDTSTGKSQLISYPLPKPVSPPPPAYPIQSGYPPQSRRSGGGKTAVIIIAILILLAIAVAAAIALGLADRLPFNFGKSSVAETSSSVESSSKAATESSEPSATESSSSTSNNSARAAVAPGHPIESWIDFPHTSEYYMSVQEDSSHIYFLEPSYYYWEGTLYRMDKTDNPVIENLSEVALGYDGISSFALVGDEIYFSVPLYDGERAAYLRVPKTGGDAELLFIQEISHMVYYEDAIYFLFDYQQSMGVYRPGYDTLPELVPLARGSDSDHENIFYFPEFSIQNDWLYYGEIWEEYSTYARINLSTREQNVLISGQELKEAHIYNVVYGDDICYYSQMEYDGSGETFLRSLPLDGKNSSELSRTDFPAGEEEYLFMAMIGDGLFVYQEGADGYYMGDFTGEQGIKTALSLESYPYAVSRDWLFLDGEAVRLSDDYRINTWYDSIEGPDIEVGNYIDIAESLAEQNFNDYAIACP